MSNYTKMSNDDLVAELILRDRAIKDMGRRFADSKEALQKENNHLKRLQGDMDESYKQIDVENIRLKHCLNDAEYRAKTGKEHEGLKIKIADLEQRIENQKKSMENMELADPGLREEFDRLKELNSKQQRSLQVFKHDFELLQRAFVEQGVHWLCGQELITMSTPDVPEGYQVDE